MLTTNIQSQTNTAERSASQTFVLVHGGWAGGWAWERVRPELETMGHRVLTPDLPGRGTSERAIDELTFSDFVDSVVSVLDSSNEPAVLVGHSSGGMIISQAAELRPRRVRCLVYVCAYLPEDGESLMSLAASDAETQLIPNLVPAENGKTLGPRGAVVREALFNDCSEQAFVEAFARFIPGEPVSLASTPVQLTPRNFGRIPKHYVETLRDRALSPVLQRRMHTAAGCARVVSMNTGHFPQYADPSTLAVNLVRLANEQTFADLSDV